MGDELLLRDGRILPVEAIRHQPYCDKVYNLHVEELECYAVGCNSVLVHNINGPASDGASLPFGGRQGALMYRQALLVALDAARQMGEGDIALQLASLLEVAEAQILENYPGLF